jgi:hypothetical protein
MIMLEVTQSSLKEDCGCLRMSMIGGCDEYDSEDSNLK